MIIIVSLCFFTYHRHFTLQIFELPFLTTCSKQPIKSISVWINYPPPSSSFLTSIVFTKEFKKIKWYNQDRSPSFHWRAPRVAINIKTLVPNLLLGSIKVGHIYIINSCPVAVQAPPQTPQLPGGAQRAPPCGILNKKERENSRGARRASPEKRSKLRGRAKGVYLRGAFKG